jgi:hypothetical protein
MTMPQRTTLFFSSRALIAVLAAATSLALGIAGCGGGNEGDDGDDGGDPNCFNYSKFDGTTPAVSFSKDVVPIFRNSCGASKSCHASDPGLPRQPYLGPPNSEGAITSEQLAKIIDNTVDKNAEEAPAMKLIAPGKPEESFLMHKLDDTLECSAVTCADTGCGEAMPIGSHLPDDKLDVVRRWIAQGAKND